MALGDKIVQRAVVEVLNAIYENDFHGVPMNSPALQPFRFQVGRLWWRTMSRRSQTGRVTWERMQLLIDHWLPAARISHPYPLRRLGVIN